MSIEQCGRVEPVIEHFMKIKFGGKEEEYGMKDWKQCTKLIVEGKHLCEKHIAKPMTVDGKLFLGWQ